MKIEELITALRRLKVETGSLPCLGCGYEHGCSLHGCVIINEALERITMLKEHFSEESALKMAAQALETTPEALRQSAQFHAGDTVWVLTRDEDGVPNDVDGYMLLAVAGNAVIVTSFVDDQDDLDSTLAYHIRETAVNFDSDLAVFPLSDCYAVYEAARAALDVESEGTLMGYINRPSAVYVSVVPAAGTIAAGFSALAAYTYDYIAGPSDISAEDATALAALVKERRKLRYIGKAVLPNTAADYEGVINFVSAGITAGSKTAFSAAAYCSRIAGMLAGTPAQCSATYAQLNEVTGVTATENPDAAVDAGKLFIIDDGRVRKLSRAVTSKVTIGDMEPEALKKIKMTAAIDLIRYYAVSSVEDDYFGKCANTYDDKCVLLLAMQDYLKSLENSKVLESGSSGAVLDADATRKYLITAAGDDATEAERIKKLSDNEVIKENTGSKVFLKLYGNIMDAMEDFAIVFEVSPSVIAA